MNTYRNTKPMKQAGATAKTVTIISKKDFYDAHAVTFVFVILLAQIREDRNLK